MALGHEDKKVQGGLERAQGSCYNSDSNTQ